MAENEKYRRITKMHDQHKSIILRWENTISKITGQTPTKDDFESAPRDVKEAYKQYHKYKRYLKKYADVKKNVEPSSTKKTTTTPTKIFVGLKSHPSFDKSSFSIPLNGKFQQKKNSFSDCRHKKKSLVTPADTEVVETEDLSIITDMVTQVLSDVVEGENRQFSFTKKDTTPNKIVLGLQSHPSFEMNSRLFSLDSSSSFSFPLLGESQQMETEISDLQINDNNFDPLFYDPPPLDVDKNDDENQNLTPVYNVPLPPPPQTDINHDENIYLTPVLTCTSPARINENNSTPSTAPVERKRMVGFSPSPKKQPKKKFFKSERKEKRYTLNSCMSIPLDGKFQQKKNAFPNSSVLQKKKALLTPHDSKVQPSKTVDNNSKPLSDNKIVTPMLNDTPTARTTNNINLTSNPSTSTATTTTTTKAAKTTTKAAKTTTKTVDKKRKVKDAFSTNRTKGQPKKKVIKFDRNEQDYSLSDCPPPTSGKTGKVGWNKRRPVRTKNVNDNFVRIDVGKKVFVRGRKRMTGAKMKRLDWKIKKSTSAREKKLSLSTCKKCGEVGHFAKFCPKDRVETHADTGVEMDGVEVDDSPWPTVEEAARMVWSKKSTPTKTIHAVVYEKNTSCSDLSQSTNLDCNDSMEIAESETTCSSQGTDMSESMIKSYEAFEIANNKFKQPSFGPYFAESTNEDDVEQDLSRMLQLFGYDSFRDGQKETILRVLKGESTLLISSTGSGKSLCYQLPAYMYAQKYPGALTLCISPLVSLMEDQIEGLPTFINGVALHCQLSAKKKEQNIELIKNKKVQVLLASPEAVASGLFGLFRSGNMPDIAFTCIDEVHCVSEWSHNFRPTYLELCKILREKLNVKTILGLTATATAQTEISICEHLEIDPSSTIRGEIVPNNLNLSVSRDQDRNLALLHLLRGDRFKDCNSIIIYCTTIFECDRVATFLRTNLQDNSAFNSVIPIARSRISTNCEAYHSRLSTARRRYVQKNFMAGKIRIVVATIAFGMGIDKSDIRAVIHYNMSKTYELYVQEIGRAGRDGLPGQCHLFLDNIKGKDLSELKRHIHSNSVDRATIRRLLRKIFKPCKCQRIEKIAERVVPKESQTRCPGHEVAFSYEQIVRELDLPAENITTLLSFLELDTNRKWIDILPMTYAICKIHAYSGAKQLKAAALKCPPLAVAIALEKEKKRFKDGDVYLEFDVVEAAATVGWSSATVKRELKNLEWIGNQFDPKGNPTKYRKSGILVEFTDLAYRVKAPGDLTDEESDQVLTYLYGVNSEQERTQLFQLYKLYQSFYCVSTPNVGAACDDFNEEYSETLKGAICEYFKLENPGVPSTWKAPQQGIEKEDEVRRAVASLIYSNKDVQFTGRAVAKILQGIASPCFPSGDWSRNRAFWRRYLDVDFHILSKIASEEILRYS